MLPVYVVIAVPWALIGLAAVLAVIRANKDDLPAIVRALMRTGPRDYDSGKGRPSLPDGRQGADTGDTNTPKT